MYEVQLARPLVKFVQKCTLTFPIIKLFYYTGTTTVFFSVFWEFNPETKVGYCLWGRNLMALDLRNILH